MAKTFAEYQAEHLKEPFPLPMPDGDPVLIPRSSIDQDRAVTQANADARAAGEWTPFIGLELLVSAQDAERVREAWGALPSDAWTSAMTDMREHFGLGKAGT